MTYERLGRVVTLLARLRAYVLDNRVRGCGFIGWGHYFSQDEADAVVALVEAAQHLLEERKEWTSVFENDMRHALGVFTGERP